jgi:hypothetical protein
MKTHKTTNRLNCRIACAVAGYAAAGLIIVSANAAAHAWHCDGHYIISQAAVERAQDSLPGFFVGRRRTIAHCSCDPDIFKQKFTPQLRNRERPEHYFDMEYLKGAKLPETRQQYAALCAKKSLDPYEVGFLPYAIEESVQRLIIVFAEHRACPDNEHVKNKCAVYAGILAHYAADACQPLHCTVHYDGRVAKPGDASPRSGIHNKVDALAGKLAVSEAQLIEKLTIPAIVDVRAAVHSRIARSSALVDTVYRLEPMLPSAKAALTTSGPVRSFAVAQTRASIAFLAGLYIRAWRASGDARLPSWHKPPK